MGRLVKRVPLDFNYPLNTVWYGSLLSFRTCKSCGDADYCLQCMEFARIKGIKLTDYGCPDYATYFQSITEKLAELCEPQKGEGYQLWETTSEGAPISPVFETMELLAQWCENNATTLGRFTATKEEWCQVLKEVSHEHGVC